MFNLFLFLIIVAMSIAYVPCSKATEINVPNDQSTIQASIQVANDGDVIIVNPGIYIENINFSGKAITVKSIDPNDPNVVASTIIDGNQIASVVTFNNGENRETQLSGITIRNGKATRGGGIICLSSSPTITDCIINENKASGEGDITGGGIACYYISSPIIINCKITQNSASGSGSFFGYTGIGKGGGIYCYNSSPTIFRCHIEKNYASGFFGYSTSGGGGIYCESSSPTIIECNVFENYASVFFGSSSYGGGIYCESSSPTIIECNVFENSVWSHNSKGGGICCKDSSPQITNCLISKNSTIDIGPSGHSYGGGIYCSDSSAPMITNCTIAENSAFGTGELHSEEDGFSYGGGICCYSSSPTINNCDIVRNSASAIGSSYFLDPNSEVINSDNCKAGNGYSYGGGIYFNASSPKIDNCIIVKNSAVAVGSLCTLDPNTYGNGYSYGGGIYCDVSSPNINNCSIADNSATNGVGFITAFSFPNAFKFESLPNTYREGYSQGGGIACKNLSSPDMTNSILWGDFPDEIYVELSIPIFNYCNIQGGYTGTGEDNIDTNPLFIDSNAGDYHLQSSSPCINAGTSEGAPKSDIDNNPRPIGSGYDIGAYEFLECSLHSLITVYKDGDSDNYGDPNIVAFVCNNLNGYVENKDDCNDNDPNINPIAIEICDEKDNNCDGKIDVEGSQGCTIYYKDEDHDEQGVDIDSRCLCSPDYLNKYTAIYSGDPDDLDPNIQGTILTRNMSLQSGWSMISLPLIPDNATVSSLFPDAVVVYGYEKGRGYVRVKKGEKLEIRRGYWILLNEAKNYTITGEIIDWYNLIVQDGWYMIGGCTSDAKASVDKGKIKVIYGYNRSYGYQRIFYFMKLEPGKGYWILLKDITEKAQLNVGIPNVIGHWAGTWEAWLTDPNIGVVTDPNGQIQITMSGAIHFHITDQTLTGGGGVLIGKVEITGWDVDPQPQEWPGNWEGESDEVMLTGWIDEVTRYLMARYYYYPGKEAHGDFDQNEDYKNIKGFYIWYFNINKLTMTETGISGQISINGTDGYYKIGTFSVESVDTQ